MFEQTLHEHLDAMINIRERLASIPAATAEPDASYWDGLQEEAEALLAVIRAKTDKYQAYIDAKNDAIGRQSRV